jgi:hypothetical protein
MEEGVVEGKRDIETARSAGYGGGRSRAHGAGSLLGSNDPSSISTDDVGYLFHHCKVTHIFGLAANVKAFLGADAGAKEALGHRNKEEAALPWNGNAASLMI